MRTYNLEKEFCNVGNLGSGLKYNTNTNKFDVDVDFSILSEHLVEVTYDELLLLKYDSDLKPGVFYRITDYEFTSSDSEVKSAGHRFDIIVLALSEDTLSEDARAIQHKWTDAEKLIVPETELNYFNDLNLNAWKLKYSLDGSSKRFTWAPTNKNYGITINRTGNKQTLYRDTNKDEGIYYAFSNDSYIYYTTSEEPIEGDLLYENKNGLIKEVFDYNVWYDSKQILIKSDYDDNYYLAYLDENDNYVKDSSDAYTIDRYNDDKLNIIHHNGSEYIVVNENYSYIGEDGTTKTGILVTKRYSDNVWLHNGNSFFIIFPITFTDYIISGPKGNPFSESYTFTLNKLPEIGDNIEIKLGNDSYVPYTNVSLSNKNINKQITYVEDYTKVLGTTPKNATYRGTIYEMVDEFNNFCEYDFKNALITGKYSLFDPDKFFYTFVNSGVTSYLHLKVMKMDSSSGNYVPEPVLLYPGTYSFLNNIPFRYYDVSHLSDSCSIAELSIGEDLYAICFQNNPIVEGGNTIYPTEIWHKSSGTKVLEDKTWYFKEIPTEGTTTKVYYKDSSGNEHEVQLSGTWSTCGSISYKYNKWVFDLEPSNVINLNYNEDDPFNIPTDGSIITTDYLATYEDNGILYGSGIMVNEDDIVIWHRRENHSEDLTCTFTNTFHCYWVSDLEDNKTKNICFEFTTPITIDKPMYLYIKSQNYYDDVIKHSADNYVLVLCEDAKITENSMLYNVSDLSIKSAKDLLVSPLDISLESYCFENKIKGFRDCYTLGIPKTICAGTYKTKLDCCYSFLLDCYLIVFEGDDMYSKNIIQQSFGIDIINSKDIKISSSNLINIKQSLVLNLILCCYSLILDGANCNLTSLSNTTVSHCEHTDVQYLKRSEVKNCSNSEFIIKNTSGNLDNLYNIDINSLNFKTVYLDEIIPSSRDNSLIQIRSEEDLTITV